MSFLRVVDVCKNYGRLEVLKGINLEIKKEDFLVLVGPSGCGKSTLLNIIAGLNAQDSGEIWINDRSVDGVRPSNRDIAMVFQSYALYPNMTVAGNICFGMEIRKVPKAQREISLREVSKLLQIDHLLDRKPSELSGGQRQRVAMGRALVRNPLLFLFDEPLSNLDAKLRVEMRTEIKLLRQRIEGGIVYVTHDQVEAMTLATKIAVMHDGTLQQFGTPEEIYEHPSNMFVAGFMGSPAMNFFQGRIIRKGGGLVAEVDGEEGLQFPLKKDTKKISKFLNHPVTLGLRPEAITSTPFQKNFVTKEVLVKVVEKTGSDTFLRLIVGAKEMLARFAADANPKVGEKVPAVFNLSSLLAFDPKSGERIY